MWVLICIYALANLSAVHHHGLVAAHLRARGRRDRPRGPLRGGGDPDPPHRRGHRGGAELGRLPGVGDAAGLAAGDRGRVPPLRRGRGGRGRLNVAVYDWDQQAAGLLYRLYRLVRLQRQVSRGAPLSQDRAVERLALLSYAAQDADVPMPRLRALVQAGQEAAVLAYEHHDGTTLADYAPEPTDAQLGQVWDDVLRLHAHRVTHRALTADHMLLTDDGRRPAAADPDRRRGRVRPADPARPGAADGRARPARRPGPIGRPGAGEDPDRRDHHHRAAAAGGRALPLDPARAAPPPERAARAAQAAADPRPRRRGRAGPARADPAAHPGDADRQRGGRLPARGRAGQGQPLGRAAVGRLALGHRRAGAVGADLRRRGAVADRVRDREAQLRAHRPRPARQLVRHAGDAGRRRRGRRQHPLPAAPEDTGGGRGRQRRRVPGGGVRHAHLAAGHLHRADRHQREQSDQAAGRWPTSSSPGWSRSRPPSRPSRPAAGCCGPGWRRPSTRCCRSCSRSRSIPASWPRESAARCC